MEGMKLRQSRCFSTMPIDLKPSLNKAFFFLSEGGYDYPISIATLKKYWSKFAPISPFVIGPKTLNMTKMFNLPPDGKSSFQDATKLLQNDGKLRDYLVFPDTRKKNFYQ